MTGRVSFEEYPCSEGDYRIAVATLENPSALNALSEEMLAALKTSLEKWHEDEQIICVILKGAGEKAFCAGGDVRAMHHVMSSESKATARAFLTDYFTLEYQCDYLIHTYTKPIIGWGAGIVMGGGMGLYMGTSHKVVTPHSRLAMPEISIGLYPDVGGTWFLNRLDPGIGLFLALTGVMVNASDALKIHFADHLLLPEELDVLMDQLQHAHWSSAEDHYEVVTELLENLAEHALKHRPTYQLMPFFDQIQHAMEGESITQVVENLLALESDSDWLKKAQDNLAQGSPITAHICYRQARDYHELSLADCFRLELGISVQCGLLGEFQEGVRARLVDKDGQPNWLYPTVADVDSGVIDALFTSLWSEDAHPLARLGKY
ncbi:enoyl-CoA hydratase/isomerase family protein [Vibrio vulnificus]|uniref:enoyl-CoA hydratase/isomerase family protein n=1 Tax=Vibrio vulnificus TaxID=672 RepID=UPI000C7A9F4D|nr:enoyl-CoA hydratase/isomerase family protein [Vibrio vulnificus]AUL98126.1 Enoyl-CoA hydratase [Vibrio vulnificus]PNG79492.1 enoyl-CoA hydratase [Vibrio vulnificus]